MTAGLSAGLEGFLPTSQVLASEPFEGLDWRQNDKEKYGAQSQRCPLLTKSLEWHNPDMQTLTATRTKSGQFAPGSSGNPGGRPKDEARVAELARSYTSEAIDTLVDLMRNGRDERVRGTAAQALLDRGWGKPKVEVVNEGGGGYLEALRNANADLK